MKATIINRVIRMSSRILSVPVLTLMFITVFASGNLPDNPSEKSGPKRGAASYYNNSFQGRKTASGEIFSQLKLTCASNVFPLGTWLRITNLKNGKTVIVKVNDRMHPRMKRVVDLSKLAAENLGMVSAGIAQVEVENLGKTPPAVN
jgi:rare lipoprotein A